jgi:hypothetical protein
MDLLKKALDAAAKILKNNATGNPLPQDEALMNKELEGPGLHIHDESNPLGMHGHKQGDPSDGGHTHTPENPGGVHAHGELAGQAMTRHNGWHMHEDGGLGGHHHKEDNLGVTPNIRKPGLTI